jgi:ssDNA-binding Zn-finger/Zn-ribbon topoisomerase 1
VGRLRKKEDHFWRRLQTFDADGSKKSIIFEKTMVKDKILICKDCHRKFVFTAKKQEEFGLRGWADPVRCLYCQRQKKILTLALKDGVNIGDEVQFKEICDKCGRAFFTKIKRRKGTNLYCDDCWVEIKYAKPRQEDPGVDQKKA